MEAEMGVEQREGESSIKVLKATIAGGLLFLLPLVLVVLLMSHALRFAGKAVGPISEFLTLDKVFGPAAEEILAVLMLVFISMAAGAHCWHALLGRVADRVFSGITSARLGCRFRSQAPTPMSGNVM